jgi:hypothetical protein
MYQLEDRLLVGEECEENKPVLEEDYKDSKLLTWFECEEAVSAAWCNTELTSLTWHESEVGPLLLCHEIREINFESKQSIHDCNTSFDII